MPGGARDRAARIARIEALRQELLAVVAPWFAAGDGALVVAAMGEVLLDWLGTLPPAADPARLLVAYTDALQRDYLRGHEGATAVQ